jgi:hypothetical protein
MKNNLAIALNEIASKDRSLEDLRNKLKIATQAADKAKSASEFYVE